MHYLFFTPAPHPVVSSLFGCSVVTSRCEVGHD